jgi:hypothetical protein
MKIFDINNIEMTNPDLSRGYLKKDRIFVKHHEAIEGVDEQWHYEVIAQYPNGGKDVKRVIDVFRIEPKDAWDEYEDIQRYIEYTEEELENIKKNSEEIQSTINQRLDKLEEMILKLSAYFDNHQNINEDKAE